MEWERVVLTVDRFGRAVETAGHCSADGVYPFLIPLVVADIGALVFCNQQLYMARKISTEFAETDFLGRAMGLIVRFRLACRTGACLLTLLVCDAGHFSVHDYSSGNPQQGQPSSCLFCSVRFCLRGIHVVTSLHIFAEDSAQGPEVLAE